MRRMAAPAQIPGPGRRNGESVFSEDELAGFRKLV
jgi:hypothetical protein